MGKENILISLGGSLIFPENGIDIDFLINFKELILKNLSNKRFFIYVGGGKIARIYQKAMAKLKNDAKTLDWLGIFLTRINAYFLKEIFSGYCQNKVFTNPTKKIKTKKDILIFAGWKPGWSTDYDTVLLAKNLKIKKIINLTNIDYVYEKDPEKFKKAKPLRKISWRKFRKIINKEWSPGLSLPFDPLAAELAQKLRLKIFILNGKKLERLENLLKKRPFVGTIIG